MPVRDWISFARSCAWPSALGDDDDEMLLAGFLRGLHLGDDVALQVVRNLRDQRYQAAPTAMPVFSAMYPALRPMTSTILRGRGSVWCQRQLVDHFHSGIHGRIIADGVIAAGDIVVDGCPEAPHRGFPVPPYLCSRGMSRRPR